MQRKNKAIILSLISVTASADISLYGRVAVAMSEDHFPDSTLAKTTSVQDYGSYFGIRGTDHMFGDTNFIFQVEQLLDIASGQSYYFTSGGGSIANQGSQYSGRIMNEFNSFATSDSYIGMSGGWGKLRMGNLSNYMRSDMGSVDLYNYNYGANGLGVWSRTAAVMILPRTIVYNTPQWAGFSIEGFYSFNNNGAPVVSGTPSSFNLYPNGNTGYSGGVYGFGVGWVKGNYSVRLGSQIWQTVGSYVSGTSSQTIPAGVNPAAAYNNAYANRIEFGYNDPDGLIAGLGMQTTSGLGWQAWANSGGSYNNYIVNPGYNYTALATNQYQTQEFGGSIGYHLGEWTPKIGYAYGNNLMYNGNLTSVALGSASYIPNSGYQQFVIELDWNITPRTIVFANYGQLWYGSTMQNISYCGVNSTSTNGCNNGNPVGTVNSANASYLNQGTGGIGFSHTF